MAKNNFIGYSVAMKKGYAHLAGLEGIPGMEANLFLIIESSSVYF